MSYADRRLFKFEGQKIQTEHGLFNDQGELDDANDAMCRLIAHKLNTVYEGHPWNVCSEIEHGIIKFNLQGFQQWPMVVHINTIKGDPSLRSIVKYGGELLERLGMPRKGFDLGDWRRAMALKPWHFNRNARAPEYL